MKRITLVLFLGVALGMVHGQQWKTVPSALLRDSNGTFFPNSSGAAPLGYTPPPFILYDSSGNPFPTGSGTPLSYTPPPFTCYTIVAGSVVPCTFSGGSTGFALTMDNSGSGDASGTTFNGSAARTISYNTIGAVPITRTVAGHALSSDVVVSASDLTTGALLNGITATTQAGSNSSTKVATTAQVQAAIVGNAAAFTNAQKAPAFYPQSITAGPYLNYYNQFMDSIGTSITTQNIGSPTGPSCQIGANGTVDNTHPSELIAASGTGSASTGVACLMSNSLIFNASITPGWTLEGAVQPSVLPATTAGTFSFGFAGAGGTNAEPFTNGIFFHLASGNTNKNNWYCRYLTTETDSTVTATLAWVRLSIVSDGVLVHWYINGTEVCGTGVAIASMPTTREFVDTSATGATATSMLLNTSYFLVQRNVVR